MGKTNTPDEVTIGGRQIKTNALPDPFDALDLLYRPKLQPLPVTLDQRAGQPILDQVGNSCTGHAVAALVDTVLSIPGPKRRTSGAPRDIVRRRVSPYMLYAMARRYDEYPGTEDVGSSLRGAFKGWYHHGVCSDERWPTQEQPRNLYDPEFVAECAGTPLGAYYRVNVSRIDDMQSAVTELNAIAVSAAIHDGWRTLKPYDGPDGKPVWIIEPSEVPIGGHAFLIAGYNEHGFLVQNSWGVDWGHNGYATLRYEDWLANAYDAWVARPGVPQARFTQASKVMVASGAGLVAAGGPDLSRLPDYVVDVTAGGKLSGTGKVSSSPAQIDALVTKMGTDHDDWVASETDQARHVVLYAHGGLVGEASGIATADRMIGWWRKNGIYPVHIVWESDALTTIFGFVEHKLREALPFGAPLDGIVEQIDRKLEGVGHGVRPLWEEMKANARAASAPLSGAPIDWASHEPGDEPGVSLFIKRFRTYVEAHPGQVKVHLVGHSAGSVVLAAVMERLIAEGIEVESFQLMGAAIRSDDFVKVVVPELASAPGGRGRVHRFVAYDLKEQAEQDDTCPGPPIALYHKSLLYFVSRSLEYSNREAGRDPVGPDDQFEVPMLGLEKYLHTQWAMPDGSLRTIVEAIGTSDNAVIAPITPLPSTRADQRSGAKGHADFDDDVETMTSVVLRIMDRRTLGTDLTAYPPNGMPTHV
jgi:Papain family cysteine protease